MNKKPLYVSIFEYSREFMEVACWWFCWWPNFPVFHGGFIPSQMALGAGCDWNSSLEGLHTQPVMRPWIINIKISWKIIETYGFQRLRNPTSAKNLLLCRICHKNPWLFSHQLRTHRSCRSFITGSEVRDLQKTWPAGRKNSQQRCGQAPQSHRLRSIWAAISRWFWMILDEKPMWMYHPKSSKIIQNHPKIVFSMPATVATTWRHWWPLVPCTACSDRPNRREGFHQSWDAENSVETDLGQSQPGT